MINNPFFVLYLLDAGEKRQMKEVYNLPGESIGLKFVSSESELFRAIPECCFRTNPKTFCI